MNLFWTLYYKLLAKTQAAPKTDVERATEQSVDKNLGPFVK